MDYKANCLNVFKILAALQVLCGHAIMHLDLSVNTGLQIFLDYLSGVPVFFTLSGFLIWLSVGRSKSFMEYAKKRFWRIYPELWVAVAVEIIAIILLYKQPINWSMMGAFAVGQATIFQFWTPGFLRGYGCGTPNGALWTIAVLIQFYFLVYFFYKWLHNRKLFVWGGVILFSLILGYLTTTIATVLPGSIGKLYNVTLIPYLWMFLVAAFIAEHKEKLLPILMKYWWVLIALLVIKREILHIDVMLALYPLLHTLLLFGGILGFAYAFPRFNIKTDISYGVYIYHMTIVNAFIVLGLVGQGWYLLAVIAISCILAWISTVTIGKMSIGMKQKI